MFLMIKEQIKHFAESREHQTATTSSTSIRGSDGDFYYLIIFNIHIIYYILNISIIKILNNSVANFFLAKYDLLEVKTNNE